MSEEILSIQEIKDTTQNARVFNEVITSLNQETTLEATDTKNKMTLTGYDDLVRSRIQQQLIVYGGFTPTGPYQAEISPGVGGFSYTVNDLFDKDGITYLVTSDFTSTTFSNDETLGVFTVQQGLSKSTGVIKITSVFDTGGFSNIEVDTVVNMTGYHEGTTVGGGIGVGKIARHNGGTVISKTRERPTDWNNQAQLTAWFADSGVDELCMVRPKKIVSVKDFGAKGDNLTNDVKACQKASDISGDIFAPEGTYLIGRNTSVDTYFNYGIRVLGSVSGVAGKTKFARYDTDISTYALAYPIFFMGHTELSETGQVYDTTLSNLEIEGNDTRHSVSGASLSDQRFSVQMKGVIRPKFNNVVFSKIDSSAIYASPPLYYEYKNGGYLNLDVVCEKLKVFDCSFSAEPHVVSGRALIKAIETAGCNNSRVRGCDFEWCDTAVDGASTYDLIDLNAARGSVFTTSQTMLSGSSSILRTGRDVTIKGCTMLNSSEHPIYLESVIFKIVNNTITVDNPFCLGGIKIRGVSGVIKGNNVISNEACVAIHEFSNSVIVAKNDFYANSDGAFGCVDLDFNGIESWLDNRSDFITLVSGQYPKVESIKIHDNNVKRTSGTTSFGFAARIYTDVSVTSKYNGNPVVNISIKDNTVINFIHGLRIIEGLVDTISMKNNEFIGNDFDKSSFTLSNITSYAVITVQDGRVNQAERITFEGNTVTGFKYYLGIKKTDGTDGGGGGSGYYLPPITTKDNLFRYMGDWTALVGVDYWLGGSQYRVVTQNTGYDFLNENLFVGSGILNSIQVIGGGSATGTKGSIIYDGTNFRFYKTDTSYTTI